MKNTWCYIPFIYGFTTRAQGYTHGIIVRFESKQAGDDYQTHELHVTVLGLLKKALDTDDGPPVLLNGLRSIIIEDCYKRYYSRRVYREERIQHDAKHEDLIITASASPGNISISSP